MSKYIVTHIAIIALVCALVGCGSEPTPPGPDKTSDVYITVSDSLRGVSASTLGPDSLVVISCREIQNVGHDGKFTVKVNRSETYQLLVFSSRSDDQPVYLGVFDPDDKSISAGDTATALALALLNPWLIYVDQATRTSYLEAVRNRPEFSQLADSLRQAYRRDARHALDDIVNPHIYTLAIQIMIGAMVDLATKNGMISKASIESVLPYLADVPGSKIKFINPYHCWYAAAIYEDALTFREVVMLNRKEKIYEFHFGWPPQLPIFTGDAETEYNLGDGYFQIDVTKGGDLSKIDKWNDPEGRATLYNLGQTAYYIIELVAGKIPGPNFNELLNRHLNIKAERITSYSTAMYKGDVAGVVKAILDILMDNSEAFALWIWEDTQNEAATIFVRSLANITKKVTIVMELLGHANETGPFVYHLVTAPKDTSYLVEQTNGVIDFMRSILHIDKDRLDFEVNEDSLMVTIKNLGQSALNWEATADSAWLWIKPSSGIISFNEQRSIWVGIERQRLSCGIKNAHIRFSSDGGDSTIAVTASGDCISARGRVTDGTSHIGVKDVLVRIGSQDTLTDDTGEYILKNILSGPQTIVASKSCYNTQQTPVTIELGFPKTVNVVMAYAGGDADTCITHKPYDHEFICPGGTGYDSMCLYEPEAVDMKLHFVRANVPWCFDSRHFKLRDCRTGQVIWETCDVNWTDHWTGWLGTNCVCIILRCSSTGHSYHVDRYAFHH